MWSILTGSFGRTKALLGRLLLIRFDRRKAFVEGEGRLDEFEPLNDILMANSTCFFDKVKALTYDSKFRAEFTQLRRKKVLQNLASFVYNAH